MDESYTKPRIEPLGDKAILVSFGNQISTNTHDAIQYFYNRLTATPFSWMVEMVPAFTTIAIYYDPLLLMREVSPYQRVKKDTESFLENINLANFVVQPGRTVTIPVCYGGKYGPDLIEVAKFHDITPKEAIKLHTKEKYFIYMIGFSPGFPYLGGLTEKLFTPRKKTPRVKITAGSVGIAGEQTGVYPLESPGGWQIIGQTPLALFRPEKNPPSLLKSGDNVQFYAISSYEFETWEGEQRGN